MGAINQLSLSPSIKAIENRHEKKIRFKLPAVLPVKLTYIVDSSWYGKWHLYFCHFTWNYSVFSSCWTWACPPSFLLPLPKKKREREDTGKVYTWSLQERTKERLTHDNDTWHFSLIILARATSPWRYTLRRKQDGWNISCYWF